MLYTCKLLLGFLAVYIHSAVVILPLTKEEVYVFGRVCLSVSLSVSKITQTHMHGLDEVLRVDRCRDMDELINF